jgi:aspartate kinase
MAIQVPDAELELVPVFSKTPITGPGKIARLTRALNQYGSVTFKSHMAILSLVGSQMASLIGMSGRMFTTLGEGSVNIEMISQGASEINISCVIKDRDAVKALNLIHQSCLQISPQAARGRGKASR